MKTNKLKKRSKHDYTHAFACYGMPLTLHIQIELHRDVAKQGKRKRFCRSCSCSAADVLQRTLREALNSMGMK